VLGSVSSVAVIKTGRTKITYFLLNPSNHNTNEICIITFNGVLLHVSAPGSHHQAKYNKPIPNY
jgi:hypothetical protein